MPNVNASEDTEQKVRGGLMKVCYVGPIFDGTGYSKAGLEYVKSLDRAGVDVVVRPVKMTPATIIDSEVKHLLEKDVRNVDAVIQHNLPSEFSYKKGVQNIGMFAYETDNLNNTGWKYHLLQMDDIVVFCEHQRKALENTYKNKSHELWDKIKDKIHLIPHTVDENKCDKQHSVGVGMNPEGLKFYAIGEFNKRKNWPALLVAYYSAFSSKHNVELVVKTNNPGEFKNLSQDIKERLGRFEDKSKYPKIILIHDFLSDEEMVGLHQSADVYVSTSHAEAWNLPCSDAIMAGNPVIVPDYGAFKDYVGNAGLKLGGMESVCFDARIGNLYSSNEHWFNASTKELKNALLSFYLDYHKDREWFSDKSADARKLEIKTKLNREKVGNQLKEIINAKSS